MSFQKFWKIYFWSPPLPILFVFGLCAKQMKHFQYFCFYLCILLKQILFFFIIFALNLIYCSTLFKCLKSKEVMTVSFFFQPEAFLVLGQQYIAIKSPTFLCKSIDNTLSWKISTTCVISQLKVFVPTIESKVQVTLNSLIFWKLSSFQLYIVYCCSTCYISF